MRNEPAIGMMIKQINDTLRKNANNALRDQDLTLTQVGVLNSLYEAEGHDMTLKEIEKAHHVTQPTAHGIVRRLAEKRLVETFDDRDNRRIKHVRLTKEGINQAAMGQEQMQAAEDMLTANLSKEEQRQLKELLDKVREGLK